VRYELTDLRLFQAIADAQGLSAGAAAVHITPSAASYRIKNLEQAMGTTLFVRTARGMELTPAGETLLSHVRELLLGVERMHGEVGRFSSGLKGHIRLLANSSSLNGFVIPSVSRFLNEHPDVNIDLEERASPAIVAAIAAQEADIGILAGDSAAADVRSTPYAVDELVIITPLTHQLAGKPEIQFVAALEFDFVSMNRTSSNFLFLREMSQRAGKSPNVRLHVPSFEGILTLVEAGVGIAMVPRTVATPAIREGRVASVRLAEPWALRQLHLIVRSEGRLPSFTTAFAEYLVNDPAVAATRRTVAAPLPG